VGELVQLLQQRKALVEFFQHRLTMVSTAMTGA
jgi:hypothetical protein